MLVSALQPSRVPSLVAWTQAAYVHVTLVTVVHAGHVVAHVAVIHVRVIHTFRDAIVLLCESDVEDYGQLGKEGTRIARVAPSLCG